MCIVKTVRWGKSKKNRRGDRNGYRTSCIVTIIDGIEVYEEVWGSSYGGDRWGVTGSGECGGALGVLGGDEGWVVGVEGRGTFTVGVGGIQRGDSVRVVVGDEVEWEFCGACVGSV